MHNNKRLNRKLSLSVNDFDFNDLSYEDVDISRCQIQNDNILYQELCYLINKRIYSAATFKRFSDYHKCRPELFIYPVKTRIELRRIILNVCKYGCENIDLNWIDVSEISDMNTLFNDTNYNGDISEWDVSNVENMSYMFENSKFNNNSITNWDVSNVGTFEAMFCNSEFNQDVSHWIIWPGANVTNAFWSCPIKFEYQFKIVQKNISDTFELSQEDYKRRHNISETLSINDFDNDDSETNNQPAIHQDGYIKKQIKKRNLDDELKSVFNYQVITNRINDGMLNIISSIYKKNKKFKYTVPVANGRECSYLANIILAAVNTNPKINLNWLDVSNITNFDQLFYESDFNGDISKWDVSNAKSMAGMFSNSKFNGDISKWDVSNVKDMNGMFEQSEFTGDISNWDVSSVEDMNCMFWQSKFNGDISNWDVSQVEDMNQMFGYALFNGDISKWDVSSVDDMSFMFYRSKFNSDISNWYVSKLRYAAGVFEDTEFNQDISKWVILSSCDMLNMFKNCPIKEKNKPQIVNEI